MANIFLKKIALGQIKSQLKKMQSETESAQKRLDSVINGLDFEVASKENIKGTLNKLNTSLYKQITLSEQYYNAFVTVSNTFVDSDGSIGSETQSIVDKIKDYIEDTTQSIKDFFTKNKIAKYAAVAGLFITAPSILCWSSTVIVLEKIGEWLKGWLTVVAHAEEEVVNNNSSNSSGSNHENTNSNHSSTDNVSNSTITDNEVKTPENMKMYTGSSKDLTPGTYSDYNVVECFNEEYVMKQNTNKNCTSTSDAMVGAFTKGQYVDPDNGWQNGVGATWPETKLIPGSTAYTRNEQLKEVGNQLTAGNPVVIRVRRSSSDYGHSMVAIGIKSGANPDSLTSSDLLIANPGTGKVCTLAEYEANSNGRTIYDRNGEDNWPLRVAK